MTVLATHTAQSVDGVTRTTTSTFIRLKKARQINYMKDSNNIWIYRVQYISADGLSNLTMDFPVSQYVISILRGE